MESPTMLALACCIYKEIYFKQIETGYLYQKHSMNYVNCKILVNWQLAFLNNNVLKRSMNQFSLMSLSTL
jgi:hypothetical protein